MNIMVGNMGTYNRKNQLKEIHKQRRQDTEDKVRSAINKLLENKKLKQQVDLLYSYIFEIL